MLASWWRQGKKQQKQFRGSPKSVGLMWVHRCTKFHEIPLTVFVIFQSGPQWADRHSYSHAPDIVTLKTLKTDAQ